MPALKFIQQHIGLFALCLGLLNPVFGQAAQPKPRIIITTDPECDDNNSLIHFLLRACDFKVDGLICASSRYHWKGNGTAERRHVTESSFLQKDFGYRDTWRWSNGHIEAVVEAYAQSYDNLKVHHEGYPTPEYLRSIVRYGNIDFEGDYTHDTPGSDLIKQCLLDNVPGKLYVAVWGGASTLARALKSIEETYSSHADWVQLKQKISQKLVICMALDQDGSYPCYIQPVWPDVTVLKGSQTKLKISYYPQLNASSEEKPYYSPEWMWSNVSSKGVMGEQTRVWGDGKQLVKGDVCDCFGEANKTKDELQALGYVDGVLGTEPKGSFLGEGDTYSFLNLIDNGLRADEDPSWGGWNGRDVHTDKNVTADFNPTAQTAIDSAYIDFDFFPAYMNGLATRYTWAVTPAFKDANHEPVISAPEQLTVAPGQVVSIKATVKDPDDNKVLLKWWQFNVGTYPRAVELKRTTTPTVQFTVPKDAQHGQTIHIILSATDVSSMPLTRYHRVVVTVK